MGVDPIRVAGENLALANRFVATTAIVGSPALAAETIIAQLQITENEQVQNGVWLDGWAAFTVGTTGTAITLRCRRTNVGGALVASSGALTGGVAAGNLLAQDIGALDTGLASIGGQIYVLTLQVTGGAAVSTVSAVVFKAAVI